MTSMNLRNDDSTENRAFQNLLETGQTVSDHYNSEVGKCSVRLESLTLMDNIEIHHDEF